MIKTKDDLRTYISEDLHRLGYKESVWGVKFLYLFRHPGANFCVVLRHYEFHSNNKGLYHKLMSIYWYLRKRKCSIKLGIQISKNCFDSGLQIPHWGLIVVNPKARIGKNCRIHAGVNIGEKDGSSPVIGNDVYIGPGAKIFGGVKIGSNVTIGANAVVNRSFPDNCVIAGVPAKIIKYKLIEDEKSTDIPIIDGAMRQ